MKAPKPKALVITAVQSLDSDHRRTFYAMGFREWCERPDTRTDVHEVLADFLLEFCFDEDGSDLGFALPPIVVYQVLATASSGNRRKLNAGRMQSLADHMKSGDVTRASLTHVLREICPLP